VQKSIVPIPSPSLTMKIFKKELKNSGKGIPALEQK
jgi:hypothetical protein